MPSPPAPRLSWTNLAFLTLFHLGALAAVVYLATGHGTWPSALLAVVWFAASSMSITGGYHRLFSHRAYEASWPVRAFFLLFGAAAVQNSAIAWSNDHRRHHAFTDTDRDPYDARRGFWWSHVGWVVHRAGEAREPRRVQDLHRDALVRWQHRLYVPLVVVMGLVVPALLGLLWGDPLGAMLLAGFLRLVVQWHMTFSINSLAHMVGKQPYSRVTSARDSWLMAFVTLGEGYHNFHHRFPADYRNGHRWFHWDPTKWTVWGLSRVGLTRDLRRTSGETVARARAATAARDSARPDAVASAVAAPSEVGVL